MDAVQRQALENDIKTLDEMTAVLREALDDPKAKIPGGRRKAAASLKAAEAERESTQRLLNSLS